MKIKEPTVLLSDLHLHHSSSPNKKSILSLNMKDHLLLARPFLRANVLEVLSSDYWGTGTFLHNLNKIEGSVLISSFFTICQLFPLIYNTILFGLCSLRKVRMSDVVGVVRS